MTFPDSQRVAEARPVSRPRFARRVPRLWSLDTGLRASAYIQLFRESHIQGHGSTTLVFAECSSLGAFGAVRVRFDDFRFLTT
jgi:hypothetical protein